MNEFSNSLETSIAKIKLNNPIIAASGTAGYGENISKLIKLSNFGGISIKGTTLKPKMGNESPRIAETTGGMLNSIGLENPGVDHFIEHKLPWLLKQNTKIFANIAGASVAEFEKLAEKLDETQVHFIELNISCPNVKQGGAAFGSSAKLAFEVVNKTRKKTNKPLIVKLTPNVTDITDIAKSVECAGADAVLLINTFLAMKIDIKTRRPILKNNLGGLSGPAIFPIALRMVWQTYKAVKIPIIGCGGITKTSDILEMLMAGAVAVQVGTVLFSNPKAAADLAQNLKIWLEDSGVQSINQLIGTVKPW